MGKSPVLLAGMKRFARYPDPFVVAMLTGLLCRHLQWTRQLRKKMCTACQIANAAMIGQQQFEQPSFTRTGLVGSGVRFGNWGGGGFQTHMTHALRTYSTGSTCERKAEQRKANKLSSANSRSLHSSIFVPGSFNRWARTRSWALHNSLTITPTMNNNYLGIRVHYESFTMYSGEEFDRFFCGFFLGPGSTFTPVKK